MLKLVALLMILLLGSSAASFGIVGANPQGFIFPTQTSAPDNVFLTVKAESPQENAEYRAGKLQVCFNVSINSVKGMTTTVSIVSECQGDWMTQSRWCTFPPGADPFDNHQFLQYNFTLTDIPVGQHTLNITTNGHGDYYQNQTEYTFSLQKTVSIQFYMLTSPVNKAPAVTPSPAPITPTIIFSVPQNLTVEDSVFPLNFTVNQPANLSYCLDGQNAVPIIGNTTLAGLSNGQHYVSVYATNEYGNNATSEVLFFNIDVPNDATPLGVYFLVVLAGSVVSVAMVILVVFLRKRFVQT
jgi:hypothetical protein